MGIKYPYAVLRTCRMPNSGWRPLPDDPVPSHSIASCISMEMSASDHTVANHLKLMEDRFTVFSSAIAEINGVNSSLEELIANDTALINSFGDPDREPIVQFHAVNFKQEIRSVIISSRRVVPPCSHH